jgi:hypothetical protein
MYLHKRSMAFKRFWVYAPVVEKYSDWLKRSFSFLKSVRGPANS